MSIIDLPASTPGHKQARCQRINVGSGFISRLAGDAAASTDPLHPQVPDKVLDEHLELLHGLLVASPGPVPGLHLLRRGQHPLEFVMVTQLEIILTCALCVDML